MLVDDKKIKHGYHRTSRHILALEAKKKTRSSADLPRENYFIKKIKGKLDDYRDERKCSQVFSLPKISSVKKELVYIEEEIINSEVIAKFSLRRLAIFLFVMITVIAPFKAYYLLADAGFLKGRVLGAASDGAVEMLDGAKAALALDFLAASSDFSDANNYFSSAKSDIKEISKIAEMANDIAPFEKLGVVANAGAILDAAGMSAEIGNRFAELGDFVEKNKDTGFGVILSGINERLTAINYSVKNIDKQLSKIDQVKLPVEYQAKFSLISKHKDSLVAIVDEVATITNSLNKIVGNAGLKRYLFVFQNNAEMRGGGGFIGSYALIDIENGKVKNIEIPTGGSYDVEAGMLKKIYAPEPMRNLRARWYFWDANWWPDWTKSAEKLAWFYENSGGPTVDGVIGLTPDFIEKILELTGPIYLKEHGITIDNRNFWLATQTFSEQKKNQVVSLCKEKKAETIIINDIGSGNFLCVDKTDKETNKPKKIIGDLFAALREKLESQASTINPQAVFELLDDAFMEKKVSAFVRDGNEFFEVLKWQNIISTEASDDYLQVTHTNIGGAKSDRDISDAVSLSSEINESGEVINTLTVFRDFKEIKESHYATNNNFDWIRVYVPLGSQLLSAKGFKRPPEKFFKDEKCDDCLIDPDLSIEELGAVIVDGSKTKVYAESGKTVFANWFALKSGEKKEFVIKYKLPKNSVSAAHKIIIQKQAGLKTIPYKINITKKDGVIFHDEFNFKKDKIIEID